MPPLSRGPDIKLVPPSPPEPGTPVQPVDDRDLVQRLQAGDASALDESLRRYWGPLIRYAMRLLSGRDAAEDVVQESFIALWERRETWSPGTTLRSLLYQITRHRILNEQRSRRVRAHWMEQTRQEGEKYPPDPLQSLEETELRHALEEAIAALPPRRREIFVLARHHQMSYRQIAEIMEISPQTVANQMSSALAELHAVVDRLAAEEPAKPVRLSR